MTETTEESVVREYHIGNTIYRVKGRFNIKGADKRRLLCYLVDIQALPV